MGTGYAVYLRPQFQEIMNPAVWRAAVAQAFFSLSLGMGGMLTFASYLRRDQNLPESATVVAYTDFGVAFVAGLVVFPVIYSLGLQGAVGASTVGAQFIAVPVAFESMGAVGRVVGLFFFIALALAILAGWRRTGEVREELLAGATPFWQRQVPRILAVLRWVVPPVVAIVLAFSLRETVRTVADHFAG